MKYYTNIMLIFLTIAFGLNAYAEITVEKQSEDFGTYKYEMDSKPSAEDLEPNSTTDFVETLELGSSTNNGDGTLTIETYTGAKAYYNSNTSAGGWRTLVPTRASGYTLEIRLRVNSQTDSNNGALYISSAASDSNADCMLRIGSTFVKWGNTALTTLQSGVSNSDDFHIFRVAMEEGQTAGSEMFTVWRDGILLSTNMTDALTTHGGLNRVQFGDGSSGSTGGEVDVDYFRFTKGAYAPLPHIMGEKDSSEFGTYKYEMDSKPSAEDLEPNSTTDFDERLTTGGGSSSSTLNGDGTLKITSLAAIATYESNTPNCAWRTLVPTRASGYTLEIRLRINSQWDSTYGVIYISSAASDSNADSMLRIGADFVKWGNTTHTTLQSGISNSDDFHIFRITMEEGQAAGSEMFTVWRDGILLSTNMTDALTIHGGLNRVVFGDGATGSTGGEVDIDYFRFTKGGYAPVTSSPGTLVLIN